MRLLITYYDIYPNVKITPKKIGETFQLTQDQMGDFGSDVIKNELFDFYYLIHLFDDKDSKYYKCSFHDKEANVTFSFDLDYNEKNKDFVFDCLKSLYNKDIFIIRQNKEILCVEDLTEMYKYILQNTLEYNVKYAKRD